MSVIGTVTKPGKTSSQVTVYRSSACGGDCGHQCVTCTAATPVVILVDNNGWQPKSGQQVKLNALEETTVKMAAMLYLLPLATGLTAALGAQLLSPSHGMMALAALMGLLAGFAPALLANRRMENRPTHQIYDVFAADLAEGCGAASD